MGLIHLVTYILSLLSLSQSFFFFFFIVPSLTVTLQWSGVINSEMKWAVFLMLFLKTVILSFVRLM